MEQWLQPHWKLLPKRWGHPWHSMCSYLAMFPPALPRYLIEQCSKPGDVVLDPFSGRGTTPLEACLAGRIGIGSDANPLAAVLTGAKVRPPALDGLFDRLASLKKRYSRGRVPNSAPPEIRMLFDGRRTLPQLLFLRSALDRRLPCDQFLLATLCGILHGNHPKDPTMSRTLSISMPNTFSMSPGYIRRYKRDHHLRKYPFDVFSLLERRLHFLFRDGAPPQQGAAAELDVRRLAKWIPRDSVALVVTSPPYLNVVRYGKFNWIRLWLLQSTIEDVDARLRVEASDHSLRLADRLRFPAYCAFLEAALTQCSLVLRPGGLCALVIGDIETPDGRSFNLAWEAWKAIKARSGLKFVDLVSDSIDVSGKVTRIWRHRKGSATKTDRILVVSKPGKVRCAHSPPAEVLARIA
jgi:hypothetical protein